MSFSFFDRLGVALALLGASPDCASAHSGPLCQGIHATADGVENLDCRKGSVSLSQVRYDAQGKKTSYAFVVICDDSSAHGTWSESAGLACADGVYACDGGACTPGSAADCAVSAACAELGQCGFADGKCILTDEGCAQSEVPCGLAGACHLTPDGTACTTTSDADCRQVCSGCSFRGPCATSGDCYAQDGACIARDGADCQKSDQCAFAGKCSLQGTTCIAATDRDCVSSEVCRTAGQCSAVDGTCGVK